MYQDDVNFQPELALQRAIKYDDCAHWARNLAKQNARRLESGETNTSQVIEVSRELETYYIAQRDAALAAARFMWSH